VALVKITFTTLAYPHLSLEQVLERPKIFGIDSIELRVADDGIHLRPGYPIDERALDTIERSGVKVVAIAGYARFSDPSDAERRKNQELLRTLILMARNLGARVVRIYAGRFIDEADKAIPRVARALNEMTGFALDNGVTIALETHDEAARLEILKRLLEILDPSIKVLYDPANMIMVGERHEESFESIKPRIAHVHIKDFVLEGGKRIYVRPGRGIVPLCRIVRDLHKTKYQGYISVEWEKMWHPYLDDPDQVIPEYIEYIKKCL
jgi:sugar phosphate isomerase/epimerase